MGEGQDSRNVSVIKDADGNSIVMINDIRFKGKRSVDWDEVKAYIEEFVGDDYNPLRTRKPTVLTVWMTVRKYFNYV